MIFLVIYSKCLITFVVKKNKYMINLIRTGDLNLLGYSHISVYKPDKLNRFKLVCKRSYAHETA